MNLASSPNCCNGIIPKYMLLHKNYNLPVIKTQHTLNSKSNFYFSKQVSHALSHLIMLYPGTLELPPSHLFRMNK